MTLSLLLGRRAYSTFSVATFVVVAAHILRRVRAPPACGVAGVTTYEDIVFRFATGWALASWASYACVLSSAKVRADASFQHARARVCSAATGVSPMLCPMLTLLVRV